jgi:hypothetical protein
LSTDVGKDVVGFESLNDKVFWVRWVITLVIFQML